MQTVLFDSEDTGEEVKVKPSTRKDGVVSLHERFMIEKYGPNWKTSEAFIKRRQRQR